MLGVTGSTRLAGVIGDPVRHSLSPLVFNAAFAAAGLDLVYVALQVPAGEGAAAAEAMRTLGISGLSVTMPHKEDVISALDELSAAAQALGAVNCIVNTEGHLVGHNTDGAGFIAALGDVDFDPNGKSVLVLGAGGAARAVTLALVEAGAAAVGVFNRSPGRAELAASGAGDAASAVGPEALADFTASADLVVNATPVGMDPDDGSPLPIELIERHHLVADLIYHPAVTPLLAAADAAGATTINGEGMLLLQAAEAFRLMTGVEPPVGAMRKAMR
jgi:shikimate dehydrogenase